MRGSLGYAALPLIEPREPAPQNESVAGGTYTLYSEARRWVTGRTRQERYEIPETPGYGGIMAEELFKDFFEAARSGASAPAPIEDSVHLLEIIEAAKESSTTGRAVRIQDTS